MSLYRFTGKFGLSKIKRNPIDIGDILDIDYRKRLFCILDKDRPYELNIRIKHFHISHYNPIPNVGLIPSYSNRANISFRYKTEDECIREIETILNLQKLLND